MAALTDQGGTEGYRCPLDAQDRRQGAAAGHPTYRFRPAVDLVFDKPNALPGHPNGQQLLLHRAYFSISGGFVVSAEELDAIKGASPQQADVRYPFAHAKTC